jgi:hypothetical protein
VASRKPNPIPTLRRLELMKPELRAEVVVCLDCKTAPDHPGFVRLCGKHIVEDLFDRL